MASLRRCFGVLWVLALLFDAPRLRAEETPPAADSTGAVLDSAAGEEVLLPPSADLAYQELNRHGEIIEQLQNKIKDQKAALQNEARRYEAQKKALDEALRWLMGTADRCREGKPSEAARRKMDEVRQTLFALNRIVKGDAKAFLKRIEDDFDVLCGKQPELKMLRDETLREMFDQLDGFRRAWEEQAQQEIDRLEASRKAHERSRARLKDMVQKAQVLREKAVTFATDIKWLILIIALMSVSVMMIIARFYPEPLQMEWVASGQVIQFMTVLVILIAILALGITGSLKENTLGTLLGGIGGYVLAQGVGRAAARSVERKERGAEPGAEG